MDIMVFAGFSVLFFRFGFYKDHADFLRPTKARLLSPAALVRMRQQRVNEFVKADGWVADSSASSTHNTWDSIGQHNDMLFREPNIKPCLKSRYSVCEAEESAPLLPRILHNLVQTHSAKTGVALLRASVSPW